VRSNVDLGQRQSAKGTKSGSIPLIIVQ
jgi:hypothetical protein